MDARALGPDDWVQRFPALRSLEPEALAALRQGSDIVRLPVGARAFEAGQPCRHYLMLLEGVVRVQQLAECGREIVLYRVGAGETCILTAASLLAQEDYAAEGICETAVMAAALRRSTFEVLLARSAAFRRIVFQAYGERLTRLMSVVEEVAFGRIDVRLAQRLLTRRSADGVVMATHQDLAAELGSAREVVSRQLKDFERRGWLGLKRGRIGVIDAGALARLANSGG